LRANKDLGVLGEPEVRQRLDEDWLAQSPHSPFTSKVLGSSVNPDLRDSAINAR
jgi:hypothetical protein